MVRVAVVAFLVPHVVRNALRPISVMTAPPPRASATTSRSASGDAKRSDNGALHANALTRVDQLRVSYSQQPLDEDALPMQPLPLFTTWFGDAQRAAEPEPSAMCLSTADGHGRPSARMVLLKAFDERGFVWYSNYRSRKAHELADNPCAALTFWWPSLERSVRVEGNVTRVDEAQSDEYFASRPPESRLGALVSEQSTVVSTREPIERRWKHLRATFLDEHGELVRDVPRPAHWGGYRLTPLRIEFWKGRAARLHDRIVYERPSTHGADSWTRIRLQP
eukprot:gb/GEZJ01003143.1/.p1 GENE.gb/GEZJ01003143.1/~~gb/GEZJ01003143.1/.p1  ORF type:complete len:279 (-),score=29.85 gb/GEZJ01003143.1/:534-1370(-)